MTPDRIAELLAPFLGDASQQVTTNDLEHISTYTELLLRWNARINLTAIRDPEEIVTRHFGESLFAARLLFPTRTHLRTAARGCPPTSSEAFVAQRPQRQSTLADIGSGAGFPGIPIKLWQPHLLLTLVESNHKKAAFLREVARALHLEEVSVVTARAESLTDTRFDTVTLRAVERFESILPVAAGLVAAPGRLALLIGASQVPVVESLLHQNTPAFDPSPLISHTIPLSTSRVFVIAERSPDASPAGKKSG